MNQKICCESGRVRVSYKIPSEAYQGRIFIFFQVERILSIEDYVGYILGENYVPGRDYSNRAAYNLYFPTWITGRSFEVTQSARVDNIIYRDRNGNAIGSINLTINPDPYIEDFTPFLVRNGQESRAFSNPFTTYPLPSTFQHPVKVTTFFVDENGDTIPNELYYKPCIIPEWEYIDVQTEKFIIRDEVETVLKWLETIDNIALLNPLDPAINDLQTILEGIKRFSLLRTCVIAGEQFLNPNQINIALGLEIGVLENIEIPFLGLESQINFWQPVPGFDQIIKTLESPPGCPPPLVKLECCPETGCREECPPGTCEVECGNYICCYDKNGKSIKRFLK